MINAYSFYAISAYERFHRNILLSEIRGHLHQNVQKFPDIVSSQISLGLICIFHERTSFPSFFLLLQSVLKTTFFLISALGVPVAYTGLCNRRVCMYLNSALHRPTREAVMTPDLIDHTLCTHINYGFADVSKNTLVPVELTDMSKSNFIGNYEKVL